MTVRDLESRLRSLIDVNQLLVATLQPEEVLRVIVQSVMRLFGADGCSVALSDASARQLAFVTVVGTIGPTEFRIPAGQGIAGWVAENGEPVIVNDVSSDPRFYGAVDGQTGFHTRSILCVPLRLRDRVIGALEAINAPEGFTEEDLEILTAFAGVAASAIDGSHAFARLRTASAVLGETIEDRYRLVLGHSAAMEEVVQTARAAAASKTTILLLGESGVGKEVLARAIHRWSPRAEEPFVAVNCVALSPQLLESELFGHEKGAFTGAVAGKKGRFELAERGTIFLDEIGELAPHLQAKLLRVLQEREIQRVGGIRDVHVDVRVIAATNRDLTDAVARGTFREDLFYRLNVIGIRIPALRERKQDIPNLVNHFLERYGRETNHPRLSIRDTTLGLLVAHSWPGNVRELQNVIERAVVLLSGDEITEHDLPPEVRGGEVASASGNGGAKAESLPLSEAVNRFKAERVRWALAASGGNRTQAARLLGMQQPNLSRLMKTLGMS